MCRTTTCMYCRRTTWSGCGNHVDQVMRGVPNSERCTCSTVNGRTTTQEKSSGAGTWLSRLFGRSA
ncbi:hypothetical protein P4U43_14660 [Arthrobacter sp. EH-1B-1]|uniref:Uncharacterized protein n=1 Tax=Arthrobacter vasquezii TaxID=2977629 RepID=A0ABT6D1V5_9MICC|nr:hypothetical protein [Arthrobacter vasquezii]